MKQDLKKKTKVNFQRFLNWLSIVRIKIVSFVKEHKIASSVVALFLVSSVVLFAAFASDSDAYTSVNSSDVTHTTSGFEKDDSNNDYAYSFSTIGIAIKYKPIIDGAIQKVESPSDGQPVDKLLDQVMITAIIDKDSAAKWGEIDSTIETDLATDEEGNKILKVYNYNVNVNEFSTQNLYVDILNARDGSNVKVKSVKAKFGSTGEEKTILENLVIPVKNSKSITLKPKITGGIGSKEGNVRNVPFSVMLGFNPSEEGVNIAKNGLKGLYFETDYNLMLEAFRAVSGTDSYTSILINDKEDTYGVYDTKYNYFSNIPNGKLDFSKLSVYNSGKITSFKTTTVASGEAVSNTAPALTLIGERNVSLDIGGSYTDKGVEYDKNSGKLTTTITNGDGTVVSKINTSTIGTYEIKYVLKDNAGNETMVKRTVKINEPVSSGNKSVNINGSKYTLGGNDNEELVVGSTLSSSNFSYVEETLSPLPDDYVENGVLDITVNITDGKNEIGKDIKFRENGKNYPNRVTSLIDTSKATTYTIEYNFSCSYQKPSDVEGEEDVTSSCGTGKLTKKVVVNETKPDAKISAPILKADNAYIAYGTEFTDPGLYINGSNDLTALNDCGDKCHVDIPDGFSSTAIGNHEFWYTYTDSDTGFTAKIKRLVTVQLMYEVKISGISTDGTYYDDGQGFIGLGSYFFMVPSSRNDGDTSDYAINFKVTQNDKQYSALGYDKAISEGTKNIKTTYSLEERGTLTEIKDGETLAAGEQTILSSIFEYGRDGDNPLKITTEIPIDPSMQLLEYGSEVGEVPYYVSINDGDKNNLPDDFKVQYCNNENKCNDILDLSDSTFKVSKVRYTVTLNPNTKIEFRLRLRLGESLPSNTLTTTVVSSWNGGNIDASATIPLTPYKVRNTLYINDKSSVTIDASKNQTSTWTIYPTLNAPSKLIHSNAGGYSVVNLEIQVTLPKGINYVRNANYLSPNKVVKNQNGSTIISYYIYNVTPNNWIEPIYFDTNFDVDIESGTSLSVSSVIGGSATGNNKDTSSSDKRTSFVNVRYMTTDTVSVGQYTSVSTIEKNGSFDVTTRLYNRSDNVESGRKIITILPNNLTKQNYNGSYTVEKYPEGAKCTTDQINPDKLNEINWADCANKTQATAYMVDNITLSPKKVSEYGVSISTKGNASDDVYIFDSYVIENNDYSKKERLNTVKISVITKQISGNVWEDFNTDGIMNSDEKKVEGATLKLMKKDGDVEVAATTSDAKGNYKFTDLENGIYYVVTEFNTAKYALTQKGVGYNRSVNSSFGAISNNVVNEEKPSEDNNENVDNSTDEKNDSETSEGINQKPALIKTDDIEIDDTVIMFNNVNLGLMLRKDFELKITKYINKAIVTNSLGVVTTKDYGNVQLAKLDVKDMSNISIKVVYTLELENVKYYPGYATSVLEFIPDGMSFNENYEENVGWVLNADGYLENRTLENDLIEAGDKRYLTVAFDIARKEAGSFINYAQIGDLRTFEIGSSLEGGVQGE